MTRYRNFALFACAIWYRKLSAVCLRYPAKLVFVMLLTTKLMSKFVLRLDDCFCEMAKKTVHMYDENSKISQVDL